MFAGITNLLWGSSAPAPAPTPASAPSVGLYDELCPMEIVSDTACSDEEMVHLPKPNSDGEDDWVVVTEGRSGKKEAPKKKKQVYIPLDLETMVEKKDGLKSEDSLMMEIPGENKNKSGKALRVESKMKLRGPKAMKVEPKQVIAKPKLVTTVLQEAVKPVPMSSSVEQESVATYAQKVMNTDLRNVLPKMAKVERQLEKMNLNRMRVEQKRGRYEPSLRCSNAKRAKAEPEIFEAIADMVKTETEMVEEVAMAKQPETVSVQPKLVKQELKLVKAEPEIVQAKPKIVVDSKPKRKETRSQTVTTSETESVDMKSAVTLDQITKEQSESDATGFQVVQSKHRKYKSHRNTTTRKEVSELNARECEEENLKQVSDIPDKMRIEPKTIEEVTSMKVESEVPTVTEIKKKTIEEVTPMKVESEVPKVTEIKKKTVSKADGANTGVKTTESKNNLNTSKSAQSPIKSKIISRRRTKVNFAKHNNNMNSDNLLLKIRGPKMALKLSPLTRQVKKNERDSELPCVDGIRSEGSILSIILAKEERLSREQDKDIRDSLHYRRIYPATPTSSFCGFDLNPYRRRLRLAAAEESYVPATDGPDDDFSQNVEFLCDMLEHNSSSPIEEDAVKRVLREMLESRRKELETAVDFNESETLAAEKALLKEEKKKQEIRLTQKAIKPLEHRRLSRKNIHKSNAARLMSSAGNGRLRRSDRLQPRHASGANNNRKCC